MAFCGVSGTRGERCDECRHGRRCFVNGRFGDLVDPSDLGDLNGVAGFCERPGNLRAHKARQRFGEVIARRLERFVQCLTARRLQLCKCICDLRDGLGRELHLDGLRWGPRFHAGHALIYLGDLRRQGRELRANRLEQTLAFCIGGFDRRIGTRHGAECTSLAGPIPNRQGSRR